VRVLAVGNMYPPHHHGGYELVWESAVEHLRARGHDVRVLTTDTDTGTDLPDAPGIHRELRWHLRDGEFTRLSPPAVVRLAHHNHRVLRRHLHDQRPDVVSWWSMGGLTLTLVEDVRRRGLPSVAFVHDDWLAYGPRVDPWTRAFRGPRRGRAAPAAERVLGVPARVDLARASAYVFVSEFTRRRAESLGLGPLVASVAPSGIHPDFLTPAAERPWSWRLLYVGRLDPRKGVDRAVDALGQLPAAHLTVVGGWDAVERTRLERLATDAGVTERVDFAGQRDRRALLDAYAACDAVVFPVLWDEPWGLVPLEAMGRGRPVVATGRGGSAEYLRDGENCLLFDPDDPGALAAAVQRLAHDPALRKGLRDGGLRTAPRHTEGVFNAAVERAVLAAAP